MTKKATATASLRSDTKQPAINNAMHRMVGSCVIPSGGGQFWASRRRRELLTPNGYIVFDRYIGALETASWK